MTRTVTTQQAADLVGVSPVTIRRWVMKGWLTPLRPNAKPLRFHTQHVLDAHFRVHQHDHDRIDALWQAVLASPPPDGER